MKSTFTIVPVVICALFLILASQILAAGNSAKNPPSVCNYIAEMFTGQVGAPSYGMDRDAYFAKMGMLRHGYVDLNGDGAPEKFRVRNDGGTMNLASLEITDTRIAQNSWPFGVPRLESDPNDLDNKRRFAREVAVLPFGSDWYFIFFSDYLGRYPDTVIGFNDTEPAYVCDFDRMFAETSKKHRPIAVGVSRSDHRELTP